MTDATYGKGPVERFAELKPIFGEILMERMNQDRRWGGAEHDDKHCLGDWEGIIAKHLARLRDPEGVGVSVARFRFEMVILAAVAVAAIESLDRKAQKQAEKIAALIVADPAPPEVQKLIEDAGGAINPGSVMRLPDGTGCLTASFPLPADHWLTKDPDAFNVPPMPMRIGVGGKIRFVEMTRESMERKLTEAGRYAVRASTMNGKDNDFDPDAIIQNLIVGMLGYNTATGLSEDEWANPKEDQK